ncbi:conserved hypothetical protein [Vibrio crassostreae]|nr:conserved hypothetical protein [Vibrio crassostreae]CAK2193531.1 conserved hypothetical protein [Vibrio crassostreae]CAK2196236.1 conserved hypothetical protein [Vibrio crassostreae]CAK2199152.1 conserved hypothetical protein [Vibrio crassostreae]CAK2199168.1 conserved hypothetical protein [Vibrio crassostreae]
MSDPSMARAFEEYVKLIDLDRNKRWVDVSPVVQAFDDFMIVTLQGLGKLDARLLVEDANFIATGKSSNPFGDISDHITQSYLWVLGAYEIIRALDQRAREDETFYPEHKDKFQRLKHSFARIRIPLAKFEAAGRHKDTDSHIAYPGFNRKTGVSWQVAENTWVDRRVLSDEMLELLEQLKEA